MTEPAKYDIIVSGGGIAGCLAALSILKHTNYSVLLIEAFANEDTNKHAGFDARVIALAAESLSILKQLDVSIDSLRTSKIKQIQVSDRHHVGQVRLSCDEFNMPYLGKVVSVEALGTFLFNQLKPFMKKGSDRLGYACPAKIVNIDKQIDNINVTLSDDTEASCNLLVVSDGGQASTANMLGLKTVKSDYEQTAIITNVKTQLPHSNVAFERFTSQGPVAFLPMNLGNDHQHAMSVVWCMDRHKVEQYLSLDKKDFLNELNQVFAIKLGELTDCSERFSYPLIRQQLTQFTTHRAVCVANAAQSLHPIAGQGFNLGIRDIFNLIQVLKNEENLGSFNQLSAYQLARREDKTLTLGLTDWLVNTFSNQHSPLVIGRNIALMKMNMLSPLKTKFAKISMGKRKSNLSNGVAK